MKKRHKKKFEKSYEQLAANGERVLGFAEKILSGKEFGKKYKFEFENEANFPTVISTVPSVKPNRMDSHLLV